MPAAGHATGKSGKIGVNCSLMKPCVIAVLLLGSLLCLAHSKSKPAEEPTGPLITVTEIKAERAQGGRIYLDGSVANTGGSSLKKGLILYFDFKSSEGNTVMTRHGEAYDGDLDPGDSTEFHFQVPDAARAVQVVVRASSKNKGFVDVEKAGPYWIE